MDNQVKQPRILIVEDDPDQSELIRDALRIYYDYSDDKNIVAVATGEQCLAQRIEDFNTILLDYHLSDIPVLQLLERILARSDIPVIFVTGENSSSAAAEAISRGAMDYIVKLGDYLFTIPVVIDKNLRLHRIKQENDALRRELELMISELRVKNIQLNEALELQKKMAITDHLTGLANRRHFAELLETSFEEARRYGFDLTCCMCDLDHYKNINDTLGHQVGDDVLVIAADVIRSLLRGSDIAARYGGDEFVLLLPHTSVERGIAVGERIRQHLMFQTSKHPMLDQPVTLSVGIASISSDNPENSDTLVSRADKALYVAKNNCEDPIVVYSRIGRNQPSGT